MKQTKNKNTNQSVPSANRGARVAWPQYKRKRQKSERNDRKTKTKTLLPQSKGNDRNENENTRSTETKPSHFAEPYLNAKVSCTLLQIILLRLSGMFTFLNGRRLYLGAHHTWPTHAALEGKLADQREWPKLRCGVIRVTTLIGSDCGASFERWTKTLPEGHLDKVGSAHTLCLSNAPE